MINVERSTRSIGLEPSLDGIEDDRKHGNMIQKAR